MHITYSYEIIDHPIITLVTKNKSNFCKTWKMQYVSFYKRLYILCLFNTGSQTLNKNETFARHNPPHHVTLYVMFLFFAFFTKIVTECDNIASMFDDNISSWLQRILSAIHFHFKQNWTYFNDCWYNAVTDSW